MISRRVLILLRKMVWKCDNCEKEFKIKEEAVKHEKHCTKTYECCPTCKKKLGIFKTGLLYRFGDKRFYSIKCKKEYGSNIQSPKVGKIFWWTFLIIEAVFIVLALPYAGSKPFLGFGSFGGFVICTIISFIISIIVAGSYSWNRRLRQIGDIIEAKHKEITKNI